MTDGEVRRYTAGDVPALRRDLADWYGGPQGPLFYLTAIQHGHQPIRPPGPPAGVARQLAATETGRLREGDLWYIDEDLCALVAAAHPSMPAFVPRPEDLPSRVGFVVFAEPIAMYPGEDSRNDAAVATEARGDRRVLEVADRLYQQDVQIVAASWGPISGLSWPAGGLWMSFYAPSSLGNVVDAETARRARAVAPPLSVDNEAMVAWRPEGAPADTYLLHGQQGEGQTTLHWARLLFATFQLAAQANLAETEETRTPRPERRRTERAGLPARDVRIARLRRGVTGAAAGGAGGGREWRHRWIVRGHWRQQWYPSLGDHRPRWIHPYPKGPEGAPLLGGDKVTVVGAPPVEVSED